MLKAGEDARRELMRRFDAFRSSESLQPDRILARLIDSPETPILKGMAAMAYARYASDLLGGIQPREDGDFLKAEYGGSLTRSFLPLVSLALGQYLPDLVRTASRDPRGRAAGQAVDVLPARTPESETKPEME